ncbi:OmpA family protein [Kordiimonas marina]|uniref:OmpA family protein n=1 Tax=Kordiimonas marina TaxID=2872312 RepID=UPI001FF65C3C|nr:OmpA family protein [Kordiimonas marina]MCJ9430233.1 OmpA family protein [Kordiimonas marina]
MRTLLLTTLMLGSALAAPALSSAAQADDSGSYYGGFELGLTQALDNDISHSGSGLSLTDEKRLGVLGGVYFGKAMGKWRLEGEYAIRKNWLKQLQVTNAGGLNLDTGENRAGGDTRSTAIMANAWYELAGNERTKLFAGMGLGLANLRVESERSGPQALLNGSQWQLAGQAMLQVVHEIPGGIELGAGVRHFRTLSSDFTSPVGTVSLPFKANEVFARLTWHFGADAPAKKAEPAPVAAPAPAPAVVQEAPKPAPAPEPVKQAPVALPGPFMVFFDWDKSTITPEAQNIIEAAAKAFKEGKAVHIQATGHADRSGPEAYNMKLGMHRAEAVKAALVALGVEADSISVESKGETDLLVPTADGVREPQNRRTAIVISR